MNKQYSREQQVVRDGRESGISLVLFRNVVGAALGLHASDMECLDLLFFRGLATPSEIAKYTGLSSGATTAMLDRLEKSGLVARQPNPDDRRGTLVVIVKERAQKIAPLFASAWEAQNKLMTSYSDEELAILSDYFQKSTALFEEERVKLQKVLAEGKFGDLKSRD